MKTSSRKPLLLALISAILFLSFVTKFEYVDLSGSNGWRNYYSIRVNADGNFIFRYGIEFRSRPDTTVYFTGHLDGETYARVLTLVDSIEKTDYDSVYPSEQAHCDFFKIVLQTGKRKLTSVVFGQDVKYISDLANLFTEICKRNAKVPADTTFEFESFKNFIPKELKDSSAEVNAEIMKEKQDPRYIKAEEFFQMAYKYQSRGKLDSSLIYFNKADSVRPGNAVIIHERGLVKSHLKKYTEAIEDLNKSIKLAEGEQKLVFTENRGLIYLQMGDTAKACVDFKFIGRYGNGMDYVKEYCK